MNDFGKHSNVATVHTSDFTHLGLPQGMLYKFEIFSDHIQSLQVIASYKVLWITEVENLNIASYMNYQEFRMLL